MSSSKLLKGTFILTIASIISRLLGFIYVVPFTLLVGIEGYILYEYAYKPYILMLSMATLGVPLAVSKFVSKYNELGDYQTGRKMLKYGILFMLGTGLISYGILFVMAPSIAPLLIDKNDISGNDFKDIVYVIRMVSFALIIVPPMAIVRGYFQGYQMMKPTAYSQIAEQIIRIIFILTSSFIVLKLLKGEVGQAVGLSTFAAFVGAMAGIFILYYFWLKNKQQMNNLLQEQKTEKELQIKEITKEMISYAIPFVIVGLTIPLYQTVDTFTVNKALMSIGYNQGNAEATNSLLALVQKVILIPVSLATAFGLTLVPVITQSYVSKDLAQLKEQIRETLKVVLFLTVPATFGIIALGEELFYMLFGQENSILGGEIMSKHAFTSILFALFMVSVAILQGINKQKEAVFSMMVGFGLKLSLNYLLIKHFQENGAIVLTNLGFAISIIINFYLIKKEIPMNLIKGNKKIKEVFLYSLIMLFSVWMVNILSNLVIGDTINYIQNLIKIFLGAFIGIIIYGFLMFKSGLLFEVLGEKYSKKLRFMKKN